MSKIEIMQHFSYDWNGARKDKKNLIQNQLFYFKDNLDGQMKHTLANKTGLQLFQDLWHNPFCVLKLENTKQNAKTWIVFR